MRHINLLLVTVLLLLGASGSQAFAAKVYSPSAVRDMSPAKIYCQDAVGKNIRFRYYTCNLGTGTTSGVAMTVSWYRNSVDATTGGTLVSTSSVASVRTTSGSVVYVPSTSVPGVYYYYCELTWSGSGSCNTSGVLTSTTTMITVSETPGAIVGNDIICMGIPTTYTNSASGGTWSKSNTRIDIDLTSGEATPVANGAVRITYRMGCGARATKTVTVQTTPTVNVITGGTKNICEGATATLNCKPSGGTWESGNTAIATIGTNRVVSGIATGTSLITYTKTNGCGTASTTKIVTVSTIPAAITGSSTVCQSYSLTYSDAVPYGKWTSSNAARASVVSTTGEITANTAGTVRITYNTGCAPVATKILTINGSPAAIAGTKLICGSGTTSLSTTTPGGAWSTGNAAVATVDASGLVTAVSFGTAVISYTLASSSCDAVAIVTVGATPASITGTTTLCSDATTVLSNATAYGSWISGDTTVATIDELGMISPVGQGTATITYSTGCGADVTADITVYTQPEDITGTASVCQGATTTLSNATTGGTWSSDDGTIASINSSGVVSGIIEGTVDITYTNGTCYSTLAVAINPVPVAGTISGTASVCEGDGTDLDADGDIGGAWTSSSSSIATVDASGVVTGHNAGTVRITYTATNSCGTAQTNTIVTVNADPVSGTISGSSTVCQAATTAFTDASAGGVWTSANAAIAAVGTNGLVSGVAGGNTTISYSVTNACGTDYTTKALTVNPLPPAGTITGTASVCMSATTALSNATSGGVWSSSDATVATVGTNGIVTGVATGTTTISYGVTGSCGTGYATLIVTVSPGASVISGTNAVCYGGSATLTNTDAGGTWTSSNAAIASVNATTGVVSSVSLGSATITYTSASACSYATHDVTVSSTVSGITGTTYVCAGQTTTLSNATGGGTWSSSNDAIATVDAATGEVTGVVAGSVTISYTIAGGCFAPVTFIVLGNPVPITGVNTLCTGSYTVLYSNIGGSGSWSSSDTTIANPNLTSGMVNGISVGTATITYRLPSTGCYVTSDVTVNLTPQPISGTSEICVGSTQTFTTATSGGTWTSAQPSVATIDASGEMSTVTAGGTIISYTMPTGCYTYFLATVNSLPADITATSTNICLGIGSTFSCATSGGTWSSSNTSVATINTTSGVAASADLGTTTIRYTGSNGCARTTELTVYSGVSAITGNTVVCKGYTTSLTDATSGGSWISSNTSVATINSASGLLTGVNGGSAFISYRLTGGCLARTTVSVAAITGTLRTCIGLTSSLDHLVSGGTWSSSNPAIASIDANTGEVSGISAGYVTITYRVSPTIYNTAVFVVNALPVAISGVSSFCAGTNAVYSGTVGGSATWSSSDVSVATIYSTSGMATGIAEGTATLTYTIPTTGCYRTRTITVLQTPETIVGPSSLCVGSSTTLTSATSGGTWSCTTNGVGTIDASTGSMAGGTAGGTTISYTLSNGCRKTKAMTVTPIPATITGPSTVCIGSTSTFSTSTSGGTWSSSNTSIAFPSAPAGFTSSSTSSLISGVASGLATIYYTLGTGCYRSVTVNVVAAKNGGAGRTISEADVEFSVYPNPSKGAINIESPVNGMFEVYTFDGKLVQQFAVSGPLTTVSLPENLATGVYMCHFEMEDGSTRTTKLLYQH
jgi:trimeric autotransporter adhesin